MSQTIKLKTATYTPAGTEEKIKVEYLMIGLPESEVIEVKEKRELSTEIKRLVIQENYTIDNIVDMIFIGKFKDLKSIENYVTKFKQRQVDIRNRAEPYYRNYMRTIENQRKMNAHVNVAPDPRQSWITAMTAIARPYGLILRIKT